MKNLILTLSFAMALATSGYAQDGPAPSPMHKFTQTVGTTNISVEYSRPGMKGRTIYGGLVPYDEVWRFGANAVTKFSFDKDVKIGGADLSAGDYAVLAKPGKMSWELHFFPYDASRWNTYKEGATIAKSSEILELGFDVETFFISFNNLRDNSATLNVVWENTRVIFPVEVK